MAFGHDMNRFVRIAVLSYTISMSSAFALPQVNYASPMGEEKWRMSGNPIRCGLALTIPNYGIGYFEQYATKQPHFILRKWDEEQRALPAQVSVISPVWKPGGQSFFVTKSLIKPGGYGIFLAREPTLKLLIYLSEGYQATFNYRSAEGFNTTVALSPIRFQKVYARYQRCLGNLLPFNYADVKETVFHFGVDSRELTDADKDQLKRIAQYVAADVDIEVIKVLGYADESGRKGYNNAVSQVRAEEVRNYLLKIGVPKKKLFVTWFGALKPIGRNDTDEGRAANRRVIVDLIKK